MTDSTFVANVIEQVTGLVEAGLQTIGRSPQPAELWAVGIVALLFAVLVTGGAAAVARRRSRPAPVQGPACGAHLGRERVLR